MLHITREPSLPTETIERARALPAQGHSLRHFAKALGFMVIHQNVKKMTSRLEYLIDWNPIQDPPGMASSLLHSCVWHCSAEEWVHRLCDELHDFLLNNGNQEAVYGKMELTIARWREYQLRIDDTDEDIE